MPPVLQCWILRWSCSPATGGFSACRVSRLSILLQPVDDVQGGGALVGLLLRAGVEDARCHCRADLGHLEQLASLQPLSPVVLISCARRIRTRPINTGLTWAGPGASLSKAADCMAMPDLLLQPQLAECMC